MESFSGNFFFLKMFLEIFLKSFSRKVFPGKLFRKVFRNFLIWLQIAFGLIFWMKEENRASKSPDGINVWVSFPFSILKFHGWWKLFQSGHSLIKRVSLLSKLNYVLISMDLKSKFDVFLILELHAVPSGDPAFSLVEQCQLPLDQPIKDKRK